ncbi:electron transport complex subunit RsxC [Vibrio sp. SCSIO 43137]|uniref:electron transport complex subunit RsxC n=1 Tax=Vibrio sp. SCSIO 43137 TaxID=3021011 RepID=UPI0023081D4F|nr:electron transport complex subunit RsxC [Vibrio sp. SCSIO 43137]WCE28759.1 electron transport complex subunit RsxC [Vibrio sp. SCSIO 43137]
MAKLSLVEQIRHGHIWSFPGGVHPQENKQQSTQKPIARASTPHELILPLKQHIGRPGDLNVQVGDQVLKGQQLTKFTASFMLPVHAPTSGTITAIEPRLTAHPSGLTELSIVLAPDGKEQWLQKEAIDDFRSHSPDELIEVIRQAGIAGMGGAGFPTARKIQSGMAKTNILIINAAECEPYITADDMLMREHADEFVQGIEIVSHILKPELVVVAVEDNKPEAIEALQQAAINLDIVIRAIPTKYPSGGEKQLIKILTNKEVPKGGIPADIGVLVQNVASVYAIKRAVIDGEPLIERVVTLTGNAFKQPQNVWVKLGTPVEALLEEFNYQADKKYPRLIMGGPMMGFALPDSRAPITKTANCILAPTKKEISPKHYETACIRCGQCAEACPASLLPQQLFWYSKDKDHDKCEELNIADCIECGACAYVCPSEIPLVHYYRQAKAEIKINAEEKLASDRAKQRFEQKKARLERDKAERENRFKKAAEDRRKESKNSGESDAIAAAIARVKSKSSAAEPSAKSAVAAAIARAKAKQAEAAKSGEQTPDNSEMAKLREERKRLARERRAEKESKAQQDSESASSETKKDAVAAAIARAKAKKAQQENAKTEAAESSEPETEQVQPEQDKKKAAVAAAIARAKAKKAQQADAKPAESSEPETEQIQPEQDKKKAAVAAAIARAKAKKAQQENAKAETAESSDPETEQAQPEQDKKKAAVAAAIARAKAKKAQQENAKTEAAESSDPETEQAQPEQDKKKAAVAAAIDRAKAKKAQQENAKAETSEPSEPEIEQAQPEQDKKKAVVAAAIARAKARKAKQESADTETAKPSEPEAEQAQPEQDKKKAAVAAAIARAKARKAQKEQLQNDTKETD